MRVHRWAGPGPNEQSGTAERRVSFLIGVNVPRFAGVVTGSFPWRGVSWEVKARGCSQQTSVAILAFEGMAYHCRHAA